MSKLKKNTVTPINTTSGTIFTTVTAAFKIMAFSTPLLISKNMSHMKTEAIAMEPQLVPVSPSTGKKVPSAIIIMVAKAMFPTQPEIQ